MTSLPGRTAVIGAGQMGAGIAHALLRAGSSVCLVEVSQPVRDRAREVITRSLERSVEREPNSEPVASSLARLEIADEPGAISDVSLVIEAVPEVVEIKRDVLAAISRTVSPEAVVATNTSSIPLSSLSSAVTDPSRFLGLHFFNPVPASVLVEVVMGEMTAPGLADLARDWVAAMGKTPIVVRDSPGFASSRLGVLIGLEAIRMLEEGVASAEDIDLAMTLGYKHPTGPLRLTDIVGLDVRLDIARQLEGAFGQRFTPPSLLIDMVAEGRIGRKSGRGFFDWSN